MPDEQRNYEKTPERRAIMDELKSMRDRAEELAAGRDKQTAHRLRNVAQSVASQISNLALDWETADAGREP
jgi:hypothetical protein